MGLKGVLNKVINNFGEPGTLRQYSFTENVYGEQVQDAKSETEITLVPASPHMKTSIQNSIGAVDLGPADIVVSADEPVTENDELEWRNTVIDIKQVDEIPFKGEIVVKILRTSDNLSN